MYSREIPMWNCGKYLFISINNFLFYKLPKYKFREEYTSFINKYREAIFIVYEYNFLFMLNVL